MTIHHEYLNNEQEKHKEIKKLERLRYCQYCDEWKDILNFTWQGYYTKMCKDCMLLWYGKIF